MIDKILKLIGTAIKNRKIRKENLAKELAEERENRIRRYNIIERYIAKKKARAEEPNITELKAELEEYYKV